MKQKTIITGKQASGKTTLAKRLVTGKKAIWIHDSDLHKTFGFSEIQESTQVIVIEDCKSIGWIDYLLNEKNILIQRQGKPPLSLKMPELIIILSTPLTKSVFEKRHCGVLFIETAYSN